MRRRIGIFVAAGAASALLTVQAPAFARPRVAGPASVTVGQPATFTLRGFKPGRVSVVLSPTASRGGNCCAIGAAENERVKADGTATITFRWPAAYYRCAGVSTCPVEPNAEWLDGERADVFISPDNPTKGAGTTVRVRIPSDPDAPVDPNGPGETPDAPAPGLTETWDAPFYQATLWSVPGGMRVPFDIRLDASMTGHAAMAVGAKPQFLNDPLRLYTINEDDHKVTFSLMAASWDPPDGMTGPDTTVQWALDWPQIKSGRIELPLLVGSTTIGLNRPSAQIGLTGEMKGLLATDVATVATWIVTRGYLPPCLPGGRSC